ncbi:MAG: Bax inhibitor-1/YccA family protein [Deltaproteobacteria bacterium]|nr:Bax inhibitor-1/YccA family protein [Deltaproteobacteria bacterium]
MNQNTLSTQVLVQRTFINKVYGWMAGALMITAIVALFTASTPVLISTILENRILFYALLIAELGLVFYLSAAINRMSVQTAITSFIGYSILNGLTLSVVFIAFTQESLASTFFVTAGTFGAMSIYGYVTKRDLTSIGNLCGMALIGLIIASLVNIFFQNSALYWITTYAGVLIFVGLTAYDTQKIKQLNSNIDANSESGEKAAIMGALALYLDFINLFLMLLRIFGRRR